VEDATVLHVAACERINNQEITKLLIQNGVDINAKDSSGKTPLDRALPPLRDLMIQWAREYEQRCRQIEVSWEIWKDMSVADYYTHFIQWLPAEVMKDLCDLTKKAPSSEFSESDDAMEITNGHQDLPLCAIS
jgi:hypothetical protein